MRSVPPLVLVLGCAACATPWSPQTADVLYSSNHEGRPGIYLQRGIGGERVRLGPDTLRPNYAEWSPDGATIVFQNRPEREFDLWTMAADGSDVRPLVTGPGHDYLPTFAPDGRTLCYLSRRPDGAGGTRVRFRRFDLTTGADEELALPSPGTSAPLSFAADGRTVVTTWRADETSPGVVVVGSIDGEEWRPITDGPDYDGGPAVSPDGRSIAYYQQHEGGARIVVQDLSTGDRRVVVDDGFAWSPRWSPDGAWLLYVAQIGADESDLDLRAVRADGSADPIVVVGGPGRQSEGRWRPTP